MRWLPLVLILLFVGWVTLDANRGHFNYFIMLAASFEHGDKVGHFVIFATVCLLANLALRFRRWQQLPWQPEAGSVLVLLYALGDELSQLYFPSRNFEWLDLCAGVSGVLLISAGHRLHLWYYNTWKSA